MADTAAIASNMVELDLSEEVKLKLAQLGNHYSFPFFILQIIHVYIHF